MVTDNHKLLQTMKAFLSGFYYRYIVHFQSEITLQNRKLFKYYQVFETFIKTEEKNNLCKRLFNKNRNKCKGWMMARVSNFAERF